MDTLMMLIKYYHELGWIKGNSTEAGYMQASELEALDKDIASLYEDIKRRIYDLHVEAQGGILP
jgi:hypothetical protein